MQQKRVFFQNAAIMTGTSLILRSIGIVFRIYVSNRIGAEGMGLYQLIVTVYVLVSSFATSGLSTAVTRLCTDELAFGRTRSAKRVLYIAVWISISVGVFSGLLVYSGSGYISQHWLHDIRAISSLKILTFSLPFMGVSSCVKGYFMARRKATSSSLAQILEQLIRIGAILFILEKRHISTVEDACFTVLLGDTIAEAASCLYMIISYMLDNRHLTYDTETSQTRTLINQLLRISFPITGGRYVNSVLRTIENVMVPDALFTFNGSRTTSLSQFGKLKGMALPLIFFPSSFLTAFTTLLIPEISQENALHQNKQLKRIIYQSLQWTLLSSYLIGAVFYVLAYPLSEFVYNDREVGRMMWILAPLTPIMYLESVVVGILKGLDQQSHSLLYSIIDSVSRIVLIITIVPPLGLNGFFIVMVISNVLTCSLNIYRLCIVSNIHIPIQTWFIRPLFAISVAIGFSHTLSVISTTNNIVYCAAQTFIISTIYIVLIFVLKCVKKDDVLLFNQKTA